MDNSTSSSSTLPNYKEIELQLEKNHDEACHQLELAKNILALQKDVHKMLSLFLSKHPSLRTNITKQFGIFENYLRPSNVIDTALRGKYLFLERKLYELDSSAANSDDYFNSIKIEITDWLTALENIHIKTRNQIRENLSSDLYEEDLECSCNICSAEYKSKLREIVWKEMLLLIDNAISRLRPEIAAENIDRISAIFYDLKKNLEKHIYKNQSRLKKSSIGKLEAQIRGQLDNFFKYPAELALAQTANLKKLFISYLRDNNLRSDLIDQEEYERFYIQLATNIWRDVRYLEREFKKFLNSLLLIKRTDISSNIIKEYLGEFWIHTNARRINRKIIYHMGPTNSGKTYHAIEALCKAKNGSYLAPLRLLAAELYDTMNGKGVPTTLLTGEEIIETPQATHYSSTIEMAKLHEDFDCCVIDEVQMLSDPQRGWAWTRALIGLCTPELHICGDHSVQDLVEQIVKLCGDTLEIKKYERMTEIKVESQPVVLNQLIRSDALIVFSRKKALAFKMDLEKRNFKISIVYGMLSPEVRKEQARKFDAGETDIIVSTDAIAMGMNLPIRRIVFSAFSKYIENQEFPLTNSEIKQIAGRCGRYQRFPIGYVSCLTKDEDGLNKIREALKTELPQKTQCMVGPDLDIFSKVNSVLKSNSLPQLRLSEFLRLFNTMKFKNPFYCVDLKEMIELAEMIEDANAKNTLSDAEIFGFACAPVNLGLLEHVQFYSTILNRYANGLVIKSIVIDASSSDIEYLESNIKCVELYQWLARHFNGKNFDFNQQELQENKRLAIHKLNHVLSEKLVIKCTNCGQTLPEGFEFAICEDCFRGKANQHRRPGFKRPGPSRKNNSKHQLPADKRHPAGGKSKLGFKK